VDIREYWLVGHGHVRLSDSAGNQLHHAQKQKNGYETWESEVAIEADFFRHHSTQNSKHHAKNRAYRHERLRIL